MPRRRDEQARVIGPTWIPSRERWRVVVKRPGRDQKDDRERLRHFVDEATAQTYADGIRGQLARLDNTTVEQAITMYAEHLEKKQNGEVSRKETRRRLRLFFSSPELTISRVTPERGHAYYDAFRARRRPDGKPISVDYHRNTLAEAKTFMRWCVAQGWTTGSPLEGVRGTGRRNAGKEQLTGDEARTLYGWLLGKANRGDDAALACLLCLLLALRQKDVRIRRVRDVDLDATVFRVSEAKTKKSNRPRRVPKVLQGLLRKRIEGRDPFEPLFVVNGGGFHSKTWLRRAMMRFCRDAGVPYICPHALKGQAASVLAETGELADKIADHLSHEQKSTTERHYLAAGVAEEAQVARAFAVISGGVK
jgi:integrase